MGIPIEKSWLDTILALSDEDKREFIALLNNSLSTREGSAAPTSSLPTPWYAGTRTVDDLSETEWLAKVRELSGAWSDMPDDIAAQIVNSRTISTREINLDD